MASNNNFYQVEREINGTKYVAQFNGVGAALDCADGSYISDRSSNLSSRKFGEYILKHVIVEPVGLTPNDFKSVDEYSEVIQFGAEVMNGKFREEAISSTTKK